MSFCVLFTFACTSKRLEIYTTVAVNVYSQPSRPDVPGNRKIATLPPLTTLPVKAEILSKDLAAYEIDYTSSNEFPPTKGFVLLGARGLHVREAER